MFRFLRSIKIWQKLALIITVLSLAVVTVSYFFIRDKNQQIRDTKNEQIGAEYLTPLIKTMQNIQKHRGAAAALLNGDKSFQQRFQDFEAGADKNLKDVEKLDEKYKNSLGLREKIDELKQKWEALKRNNLQMTAKDSTDQHSKLLAEFETFFLDLGDSSGLVLDPEAETYYLAYSNFVYVPQITESAGLLRAYGTVLVSQKQATSDDKTKLIGFVARIQVANAFLGKGLEHVFKIKPELQTKLGGSLGEVNTKTTKFIELANSKVIFSPTIDVSSQEYFENATATIDSAFSLYDATDKILTDALQQRYNDLTRARNLIIGIIALGIGLALALAIFITLGITRQVGAITQVFGSIGLGDFSARTKVLSEDELGMMASSLNAMLDNTLTLIQSSDERDQIQQSIMKLLDEMSGVAEGDLTQEAEVTAEITGAIADSFNFMIGELRRVISNVQDVTLHVSAAANEVQTTTEHLAQGSESQAVQIVDTSAAIEEMAASIQQVAENAVMSASVSEQARSNAKQGTESVQKTISGMNSIRQQVQETAKRIKRLGESSQEIGEIVQLIGDIADRTSILALNASIQAAMAGEAGRGFAVVAGEVERLAERSAEATKRISTLIKTIQSETNEAVAAMETTTREVVVGSEVANEAGKALNEIELVSNRLAELMQSISMATKQQARGSESVAKAMGDISDITQQTAAGTKQAAVSIRNLSELADNLRVSVSTFKLPTNGRAH